MTNFIRITLCGSLLAFSLVSYSVNDDLNLVLNRGIEYLEVGMTDSALQDFNHVLASAKESGNRELWTAMVSRIGRSLKRTDPQLALAHYEHCLKEARAEFGERDTITAELYARLGDTYRKQPFGKYYQSLDYLETALEIFREHDVENRFVGFIYHFTGSTCTRIGSYQKALNYLQRSVDIRMKLGDSLFAAKSYNDLGIAYQDLKQYEEAMKCYDKAMPLLAGRQDPGSNRLRAILMLNKGECLILLKQFNEAKGFLDKSLLIFLQGDSDIDLCDAHNSIANWHHHQGEHEQAMTHIRKALEFGNQAYDKRGRELAKIQIDLGRYYMEGKNYDLALGEFQAALHSLIEGFDDENPTKNPSTDLLYPEPWIMIALKQKAMVFLKKYQSKRRESDLIAAMDNLEMAIDQLDLLRDSYTYEKDKEWLFASFYELLSTATSTAITTAKIRQDSTYLEKAFGYLEKSKAYSLLELFKGVEAEKRSGIPDSLIAMEQLLREQINQLNRQIYESGDVNNGQLQKLNDDLFLAKSEFDQLSNYLRDHFPSYHQLKYEDKTLTTEQIRKQLLTNNSALIEYLHADTILHLFVITPGKFEVVEIPIDSTYYNAVHGLNHTMSHMDYSEDLSTVLHHYVEDAFYLYQLLLEPARTIMNSQESPIEKVTIVTDGIMSYIPFEALLTDAPDQPEGFKQLPYVLHDLSVNYAYSATTLAYQWHKISSSASDHQLISFAPVFKSSSQGLAALEYSEEETGKISTLLNGHRYLGSSATESTFKSRAGDYRIVHLATHALINDDRPLYSKLMFSDGEGENEQNTLYTYELFNMELQAELAVLSACNTGKGQWVRGEGIMSLAKGFAYAGCPSVVMSLWQVSDYSTSGIMVDFYESLKAGNSKDEALRISKLNYLSQADEIKSHPFFWAGFVLQGDPSAMDLSQGFLINTNWIWAILILILIALSGTIWYLRLRRKLKKL